MYYPQKNSTKKNKKPIKKKKPNHKKKYWGGRASSYSDAPEAYLRHAQDFEAKQPSVNMRMKKTANKPGGRMRTL